MKNKKGFTLIELLAVIVVLAIIMVIATIAVNRQIKKARKDSNEINKEVIKKAVKTCLLEHSKEDCNSISSLQSGGYLEDFEDPWDKNNKNLDNSYAIVIGEDDNVEVIYSGNGIMEENETPPSEYFSWCNSDNGKHKCTDGLTIEGKKWLQEHDSVLIIPTSVTEIKDCESGKTNCDNFSNVNISMLVINNTKVNANFSGSSIDLVRIDSGSIGNSKFQNTNIKNLVIGNAGSINIGEYTFQYSKIDNFTIESGSFSWYGFQSGNIGTLTIGEGVTNLGSNTFNTTNIDKIVLKANITRSDVNNQTFRNAKNDTILVIDKNVTKLPKNLFGNTVNDYNGYTHWFDLKEVIIQGDKTRFSKADLYNFGLRWDQIPDDVGDPNDESSYNLHIARSNLRWGAAKKSAEAFAKEKNWFIIDEDK